MAVSGPGQASTRLDSDVDGCSDSQELWPEAAQGGLRDPDTFWDFFDTPPRNQSISVSDIFAVVARFGATSGSPLTKEQALVQALTAPPPAPAYHAGFDRTAVQGEFSGPPDGAISVGDILLSVVQFGHSCLGPEVLGSWTSGTPMPTPRTEVTSAALDGIIYVIGGFRITGGNSDLVEAYDTVADDWDTVEPVPEFLDHAGAVSVGDKVYVVGGYESFVLGDISNDIYEYDPGTDMWSPLAPMPLERAAAATVVVGDVIYVLGGVGTQPTVPLAYDTGTNMWTQVAPMNDAREHLTASVVDGKIYVVGGRQNVTQNVQIAEVYDPVQNSWTPVEELPTARGGIASGALDDRVHVVGGEQLGQGGFTFPQHEVYDPANDTWLPAPPLPTSRHGLTAQVVDGKLYVIGGGPTPALSVSDAVEIFQLKP